MSSVTLQSGIASTSNNAAVTSASFTPAEGDLLVVAVLFSGKTTAPATPTASANGITFVQLGAGALQKVSADSVTLWVAQQLVPASPAAMTVSCNPTTATGGIIFVFSVTGMLRTGTAAVRQAATLANQSGGITPAITFNQTTISGNPLLGAIFNGLSPPALTPPTGWTETATIGDIGYSTPANGGEVAQLAAGGAVTTVTWNTSSSTGWCGAVLELDTSAPPVPRPPLEAGRGAPRAAVYAASRRAAAW